MSATLPLVNAQESRAATSAELVGLSKHFGSLKALDKDGRLVLGGIHMSDIPGFPYQDIYWERVIRSVANNTREDGREFLAEATEAKVRTHTQAFSLEEANEALIALKHDAIKGAGVLVI